MIEQISKDILKTYKSPEDPTVEFGLRNDKGKRYEKLMADLTASFTVQDFSDFTCDTGCSYLIDVQKLFLLSLVGPYTILMEETPECFAKTH